MIAVSDETRLFIGGEWANPAGDERIEVVSPVTEEVIASVPAGTREDIDRAVAAAQRALTSGPWPSMTLEERIGILRKLRDLLVEESELLAETITQEMGCPISQSRSIQVVNPVRILEAYLETAAQYPFRAVRSSSFGHALVLREPVGVVAGIVPWNVPLSLTMQKLVPALLTGCTLVLKPSPETPLDAYHVGRMLEKAGCPPGVVNIVPAGREVSEYLVSHPGVNKVTFTGSSAAGRRIAEICGRDLRRVTLELGGKSAAIVLNDADLDQTISALRLGSFRNNGQICTLKTRLLVPVALQEEFVGRLSSLIDSMQIGDPRDAATDIGPLVSERQRRIVEGYITSARADGARLATGGGRPEIDRGWFVEPTVFADVSPNSRIAQEEIFGPVVAVIPYHDEEEAISIANNTSYGLNGSVFTRDIERGLSIARRMETGTVEMNGSSAGFLAPMGGVKHSGLGREFGPEGLDPFVELKSVGISSDVVAQLR